MRGAPTVVLTIVLTAGVGVRTAATVVGALLMLTAPTVVLTEVAGLVVTTGVPTVVLTFAATAGVEGRTVVAAIGAGAAADLMIGAPTVVLTVFETAGDGPVEFTTVITISDLKSAGQVENLNPPWQ